MSTDSTPLSSPPVMVVMPSPKSGGGSNNTNNTQPNYEANRRGRLAVMRASSFQGGGGNPAAAEAGEGMSLPRPRTVPELMKRSSSGGGAEAEKKQQQLTKVLVKVEVVRSIGAVHVVVPMASTVEDLIVAAVGQYVKECRRPVLESKEPSKFDLHYSQFSLESLDRKEKLMELGSRNFFLCPNMNPPLSSCFNEAEKPPKKGLAWLKFMDFMR